VVYNSELNFYLKEKLLAGCITTVGPAVGGIEPAFAGGERIDLRNCKFPRALEENSNRGVDSYSICVFAIVFYCAYVVQNTKSGTTR
jgi:hypothetical protein